MPEHTITWSHVPHLYSHQIIQNSGLRLVLKHAFNVQRGAAGGVSHARKWQTDINAFNDTYCHLFGLKWYSCPSLILLRAPCHIKNPKGGLQAFKHLMWAISVFRTTHNKKAKPHRHMRTRKHTQPCTSTPPPVLLCLCSGLLPFSY